MVFLLASFSLTVMQPNSASLPAIEGEQTARRQVP
jgi:hypothetical protein